MKKCVSILLGVTVLSNIALPVTLAKEFNDVPDSHWAFSYVDELSNNSVINGYDDGSFKPNATITKAEYVKLLVTSVASKTEIDSMQEASKTSAEWYEPYTNYVVRKDIMSLEEIGDLKASVSRKDMAIMLVKFADYANVSSSNEDFTMEYITTMEDVEISSDDVEEDILDIYEIDDVDIVYDVDEYLEGLELKPVEFEENSELDEEVGEVIERDIESATEVVESSMVFSDISTLTLEEQEDILYAFDLGLVNGYEDGTFGPDKNMTRAEVATIVFRFTEMFNKIEK